MNKDVIYIDVDDDITAIIGKVKASGEKIVALVPPKRIGALQSAVNLRLLDRAATTSHKRLVIITGNQALAALSASANIPVAKNLQSKPELAEIAALEIDDGEDIIDGAQLPVGEHAKTIDEPADVESATDKAAAGIIAADSKKDVAPAKRTPKAASKGNKVPNFNTFRKKLVICIIAGVLLLGFAIWALFFAARATVVITARTSSESVTKTVTLNEDKETSFDAGVIRAIRQEEKKSESVTFEPTGEKDVGEKATGTVRFSSDSYSALVQGITIAAGTVLTSTSGAQYATNTAAQLSVAAGNSTTVGITAVDRGSDSNGAMGAMSGAPASVSANLIDSTSGGTDKVVKVVTSGDVQKATQALSDKEDAGAKNRLVAAFGDNVRVIESSFNADKGQPKSSPAVGQEASGSATLSTEITYSVTGVAETELSDYLEAASKDIIADQPDQRVYDNGAKAARFGDMQTEGGTIRTQLIADIKIGPQIKDEDVKEKVKGKRFGDIQADLEIIQGVENVDVKFWPFWVRTVPNNDTRINIEFKVDE